MENSRKLKWNETMDELESLKHIYTSEDDELVICFHNNTIIINNNENEKERKANVEFLVKPRELDNHQIHVQCKVRLAILENEYPDRLPMIDVCVSRGLNENQLELLKKDMVDAAEPLLGGPLIYSMLEAARDFLSSVNMTPADSCAVCQSGFNSNTNAIITLNCFHHIHNNCFSQYICHLLISELNREEKRENEKFDGGGSLITYYDITQVNSIIEALKKLPNSFISCCVCRIPIDMNITIEHIESNDINNIAMDELNEYYSKLTDEIDNDENEDENEDKLLQTVVYQTKLKELQALHLKYHERDLRNQSLESSSSSSSSTSTLVHNTRKETEKL